MPTSFVEAPRTATVFGSKSGRNCSNAEPFSFCAGGSCPSSFGLRMKRASTATAPLGETMTGLRSASVISSPKVMSNPSAPPMRSMTSTSASLSTGASPRTPSSRASPFRSDSMARACRSSIGQIRNDTSFNTSTKMPPRPTMIMGPNWGSRTPPITTSRPGGIISSTSQPSTATAAILGFWAISAMARRTAGGLDRLSATPPASDLCRICADTTLATKGARMPAAADSASPASRTRADFGVRTPKSDRSRLPAASSRAARPPARASPTRSLAAWSSRFIAAPLSSLSAKCA